MLELLTDFIERYTGYVYINNVQFVKNINRHIRGLAYTVKAIVDTNVNIKVYLNI